MSVIGSTLANNIFLDVDPIGKDVMFDKNSFKIVGVLDEKGSGAMGNDQDDIIVVPYTTMMERVMGVDYLRMISTRYILTHSDM